MPISRLSISNIRNIRSAAIEPSSQLNFIVGENGAGKSALLESITLLSHGRSFRTNKISRLINESSQEGVIHAKLDSGNSIGVSKERGGGSKLKISGESVSSLSKVALELPTQIINENTFELLNGPAKTRRKLFDWLVFHVKHDFKNLWKSYNHCLKQRNTLLRRDKIQGYDLEPWDLELSKLAESIDSLRGEASTKFFEFSETYFKSAERNNKFEFSSKYKPGWKEETDLKQQLTSNLDKDIRLGYTSVGSHRAEFVININKWPANEILSRGQLKSLILSLIVAQVKIFNNETGKKCVLLIDDLAAELDDEHIEIFSRWVKDLDAQVFVTGVNPNRLINNWFDIENKNLKLFHVKQGEFKEENP